MIKRRHSLSGRLLLLFLLTAVLLAVVVRTGFRFATDRGMADLAAPHLAEYVQHLLHELGDPPTIARAEQLSARLPLRIYLQGAQFWSSDGTPPKLHERHAVSHQMPDGKRVEVLRGRGGFAVRVQHGDTTVILAPDRLGRSDAAPWVALATIAGLLAVLLLAYQLIRRLFRPIEQIQAGVALIGAGDLGQRLEIQRRDELGALATSINTMADDIQSMLEAKRELLLAISHELRSPLTRARLHTELLPENTSRDALLNDLGELETLLGELLESERLSGRHVALDRQAVDPSVLLCELVEEAFSSDQLQLDLDPTGTWLSLDATRIRLLARNLLKNALAHTPADAQPPRLSSHTSDELWRLTVSDHGTGIAAEHLAHITEPFYRADPSRQRRSGGVGLGLYLARAIVEAHGGELEIDSTPGQGTRVSARIPLGQE